MKGTVLHGLTTLGVEVHRQSHQLPRQPQRRQPLLLPLLLPRRRPRRRPHRLLRQPKPHQRRQRQRQPHQRRQRRLRNPRRRPRQHLHRCPVAAGTRAKTLPSAAPSGATAVRAHSIATRKRLGRPRDAQEQTHPQACPLPCPQRCLRLRPLLRPLRQAHRRRRHLRVPVAVVSVPGSRRPISRPSSRISTMRLAQGRTSSLTTPLFRQRRPSPALRIRVTSTRISSSLLLSWAKRATRRQADGQQRPAGPRRGAIASRKKGTARQVLAQATVLQAIPVRTKALIALALQGRLTKAADLCS